MDTQKRLHHWLLLVFRKSWTWAVFTVQQCVSWWDVSGVRWRVSSLDFHPEKWLPCLWDWLTGKQLQWWDLHQQPAAHDYTCCLKSCCGYISAFVTTTEAFCVPVIYKCPTFECGIAQWQGCLCVFLFASLSRYKLKFSPDKVDTMIVQAICKSFSSRLHPLINFWLKNCKIQKLFLVNWYFQNV